MASIMQERRREHLNTPHLATASGSIASFQTDMRSALEEIKIHFYPQQSGSGTPSPSNIRPITGWTGCDIIISPTQVEADGNKIPVSWSALGTVYGGWIDATTGEIWRNYYSTDLGTKTWTADTQTTAPGCFRAGNAYFGDIKYLGKNYCTAYKSVEKSSWTTVDYGEISVTNSVGNPIVRIRDEQFVGKTASEVETLLNGVQYVYEINNPVLVGTISPIQLKTLIGQNNIWANTNGDVDVKYWKH